MSDSESSNSASPSREILDNAARSDEVLNDHRHQPASLPIRGNIQFSECPIVESDEEEQGKEEDNSKETERIKSSNKKQEGAGAEGLSDLSPGSMPYEYGEIRTGSGRRSYGTTLRTDFYLKSNEEDDDNGMPIIIKEGKVFPEKRRKSKVPLRARSQSMSDPVKIGISESDELEGKRAPPSAGILMNSGSSFGRRKSRSNSNSHGDIGLHPMAKQTTNDTNASESQMFGGKRERRPSRSSIDSEADSHASRSSQETEEDVCFPMLREHVRVKGIDFDEIEEFIKEEKEDELRMKEQQQMIADRTAFRVESRNVRSTGSVMRSSGTGSSAALKYTPKTLLQKTNRAFNKIKSRPQPGNSDSDSLKSLHSYGKGHSDSSTFNEEFDDKDADSGRNYRNDDASSSNVKFGSTKVNDGDSVLPDRFSFFSSESEETIHAPDIPSLVEPGQSVRDLFKNGDGTWWLDCSCPTDSEMKMLAKAFGIHPLTAEDIRMQETREKVELFKSYYFVCFHTFEPDRESEDYLEPINVYMVVFRDGVLSFHFSPISHPANVRRRVRQLRDYVDVSADWLCYALIDDITDGFAPIITAIEYEADAIEDSVFVARELDFSNMLQRIGEARRKVMTLMRLLSGKADVIKMFAKRCQDEAAVTQYSAQSHTNLHTLNASSGSGNATSSYMGGTPNINSSNIPAVPQTAHFNISRAQPRADIALYLGDIQDHVVTMFQNLVAYEKILSRSHSNYLAQLQVESFNSNNRVTEMLSKVTLIGTLLVPLNLVTGLFGMNVRIPGQDDGHSGLEWFFGIMGVMVCIAITFFILAKLWLRGMDDSRPGTSAVSSRRSIRSLGLKNKAKEAARSIISFPNKYD